MGILRIVKQIAGYADAAGAQAPKLRYVDWNKDIADIAVRGASAVLYEVAAGQEKTIFDGSRALSLDGTTAFSLQLIAGYTDRYRFRWTGGTNPVFRTARALDLSGATVTVVVNANSTATMTVSGGSFASVQAADVLWVPGAEESVASPFNVLNQGFWTVLAATSSQLVLSRADGATFEAYGEANISVTAAEQVQAFSSDGVQVGDTLEVSAGFSASAQRAYPVVAVTSKYIDVTSGAAVAAQSGITPGAASFLVYTSAKTFVYIEADQDCVVRANGDTGSTQRVSPWIAADSAKVGSYERTGPTWTLKVLNRSSKKLSLTVISSE